MKLNMVFIIFLNIFLDFSCSSVPLITAQNRSLKKNNLVEAPLLNTHHSDVKVPTAVTQNENLKNAVPPLTQIPDSLIHGLPVNLKPKPEYAEKPVSGVSYPTNYKKIGVILPLTGKNSVLGQRALTAIRIGLNINSSTEFSLALYDTQGNPELAAKGVEKLLQDEQVIALLGGLGSKEATAIASRAEFFQIPFFTFSQKSDLTDNAKYTFRNSVTPAMQTSKLVEFAVKKLGFKKFAILYPNDAYGVEFANQFWNHVLAYGGSITASQVYDPKDVDLTTYIQKLVGTYYIENREEEYKNKLILMAEKKKKRNLPVIKKSRENEIKENILDPIVDFDAIFIPDSSKAMGQAIGFFKAADVNQMSYLGTNLWNTDDLIRRANQTTTNNNNHFYFVDTVITDEQRKKSEFNSAFVKSFNEEPSIIEVQTYESAKILHDIILSGARDRYSLASRIKEFGRRSGAFSEIYMNNSNEIVRDLSVLSLEGGLILPQ